jgi:hypothetical protein
MVRTLTNCNRIREPLRASGLKEGAVVVGGEEKKQPWEGRSDRLQMLKEFFSCVPRFQGD